MRTASRYHSNLPTRIHRDGHVIESRSVDLSTSGVLIRHNKIRMWPMVQTVELDIGHKKISALARTAWCFGDLHAVHFVGMDDVDRLEIAEHLDRQSAY